MTKSEFLAQLKKALQGNLSSSAVQENMDYYDRYIIEETAKGKSEQEVVDMLGDPWILARTITDASDGTDWETVHEAGSDRGASSYEDRGSQQDRKGTHMFALNTWIHRILSILFVVMVILLVVAIVRGVVALLAPLLVPILIVMIVVRIFGGRRS